MSVLFYESICTLIIKSYFCVLCLLSVQVLASVLMCLLDWLMVIPVSKLLSKTSEDENVTLLARVFQVKKFPARLREVRYSYSLRSRARKILTDDVGPCTVSDWLPITRENSKPICSQSEAVHGSLYNLVISLVEKSHRKRWGEERTKRVKIDSMS